MEMIRPNGKVYRSRKPPEAFLLEEDWNGALPVLVVRTNDEDEARELALAEAKRYDGSLEISAGGEFGWWRRGIVNHDDYWYGDDSERGAPGFMFTVD